MTTTTRTSKANINEIVLSHSTNIDVTEGEGLELSLSSNKEEIKSNASKTTMVKPNNNSTREEIMADATSDSSESSLDLKKVSLKKKEKRAVETGAYDYPSFYAKKNVQEKSLEDQAGFISDLFLSYLGPLLRLGATKVLEQEDIGAPSDRDRAEPVFIAITEEWKKQVDSVNVINTTRKARYDAKLEKMTEEEKKKVQPFLKREPGLATALMKAFGPGKAIIGIISYILSALLGFVPVLILKDLVTYFEEPDHDTILHPWFEVALLGLLPLTISVLQTRSQVIFQHCAIFTRTAISTLLYGKSLSVSAPGKACTSTGQVVNMMSNDTTQLQRFIQFGGMTLVAPLQIIISLALIYQQVGNATWVGVGFMFFLAPVNIVVFSVVSKMRRKVLKYSDLRVKMMNEILAGIRIIKFYAWEKPFKKEVGELRGKELKALTNLAYVSAVGFSLILLSAPIIQPILVFLTYINIQDEPLTAATAFTTVALFNIMRFPFAFMPMGMLQFIQSRISLRRLGKYLALPELVEYVIPTPHPDDSENPDAPGSQIGSVTMKHASFSWTNKSAGLQPIDDRDSKKKKNKKINGNISSASSVVSSAASSEAATEFNEEGIPLDLETLSDISITINSGELVAVIGTVGAGKSSFLSSILGEMEPLNDSKVYIPRNADHLKESNFTAYSSQTPWVVNDTLRGNILFGREFCQKRYDEVLKACALVDDLSILPAGDMTEIGERGINLSGGQKARVSLARALYAEKTKILLLDDPLSAVDAHVGEHLFKHAITGDVSKGTTRILVTHHVHFLPRCDKVIVLEDGKIKHCGKYSDLIAQGVSFAGAVDFDNEETTEDTVKEASNEEDSPKSDVAKVDEEPKSEKDLKEEAAMKNKGENLTAKEEREEGAVDGSAYLHYAKAGGSCAFFSMFAIQGVGRGSEIMGSFWLAYWAEQTIKSLANGQPLSDGKTSQYLNIYAAFGMLGVLCLTARSILMAVHRLHASRTLHSNLTHSILRAPVAFFDVTPTGRVLNRFAADMDKIDLDLTQSIGQGMGTTFNVLGALGAIIAATKGTFLVPLVPIGYLYYMIQKWFRKTSTELQRVTSIAGSPIFADFSQVLSGTSTIRAYDEQKRFFAQCQSSFDKFNASYNLVYMCNFWLGLRLDFLGGLIGAFIAGISVATASYNFIPAGWLGLALSYAIEVTGFLKHGVRMIATIEADMNSVERVLFYTNNIDEEAPEEIPGNDPSPKTWPSEGKIEIEKGSMRYRDGPLILKKLSLVVHGGEKIGIVGRTGSGKSSLMNLLFRITELENDGGKVIIDGVDVSKIGTSVLRLNLSIIPQDPVMFSNTVRYNLDPFGDATDSEIWDVLSKVHLADVISALPGGLEEAVAEGGENFSQGQRQLLCIARSLLRNPKILVMDEATASIDNSTDASIQEMIRENFADSTVLTIAHRLNTIMDSDRVLVLDDGHIVEFDTPSNLLAKPTGIFKGMVDKSKAAHSTGK